jgi:hypothetical protein
LKLALAGESEAKSSAAGLSEIHAALTGSCLRPLFS